MSTPLSSGVSRRRLLQGAGVSAAAIALGIECDEAQAQPLPQVSGLFSLGVASGAPASDGVVLWTRLAPEPLASDGSGGMPDRPVSVKWEVAADPQFRDVVRRGQALAQPVLAHSVHPRVRGLDAGTTYWYRFRVGKNVSPTGRFKTLPKPGAEVGSYAVGLVSCQAWYHGHFTAHRHLAAEADLDLVVFAGDYIYEYGITEKNLRRHGVTLPAEHTQEVVSLEQYRLRYALFKTDPHLQAVHARACAVAVWDDHEVVNNYAGSERGSASSGGSLGARMANAYRAFYENLPLDLEARPVGSRADVTTGFDVGRLARFSLLDSRQFRDGEPRDEAERTRPDRTILGRAQERWVDRRLRTSEATWNVLVNGVVVSAITDDRTDMWDGFPAARERLLTSMKQARNPVMLTGDIHRHVAAELQTTYASTDAKSLGVELACTSVASDGDGAITDAYAPDWLQHDYVKHYDGRRGYVHIVLTPEEMTASYYVVDWVEWDDQAPKRVSARFRCVAGSARLERLSS